MKGRDLLYMWTEATGVCSDYYQEQEAMMLIHQALCQMESSGWDVKMTA